MIVILLKMSASEFITQEELHKSVVSLKHTFLTFPLSNLIKDDKVVLPGRQLFHGKVIMAMTVNFVSDQKEECEIIGNLYIDKFLYGCRFTLGGDLASGVLERGRTFLPHCIVYPFTHIYNRDLNLELVFEDMDAVNMVKEFVNIHVGYRLAELNSEMVDRISKETLVFDWFDGNKIQFTKGCDITVIRPGKSDSIQKVDNTQLNTLIPGVAVHTLEYKMFYLSKPTSDDHDTCANALMAICQGNDIAVYDETSNVKATHYSKLPNQTFQIDHRIVRSTDAFFNITFEFPFDITEMVSCNLKRTELTTGEVVNLELNLVRKDHGVFCIADYDIYNQLLLVGWALYDTDISLTFNEPCNIKSILTKTKVHISRALYHNSIRMKCEKQQSLAISRIISSVQ